MRATLVSCNDAVGQFFYMIQCISFVGGEVGMEILLPMEKANVIVLELQFHRCVQILRMANRSG